MKKLTAITISLLISLYAFGAKANVNDDAKFHKWLEQTKAEAIKEGISRDLVNKALHKGLKPKKRVIKLDKKQPEKIITFEYYKRRIVNDIRIKKGRELYKKHKDLLERVAETYGVPAQYIVALWGIETNFGTNTGGFDIVPALVTLSYEGRRAKFFKKELFNALKIVDNGDIALEDLKGSWAGAMGQCQFMPSSYLAYAVDYNGDGKRDIWNTKRDVFASIANYLAKAGWKAKEPYMQRIKFTKGFNKKWLDLKVKKTVKEWKELGVTYADGSELPNNFTKVSLVQPGGKGYKKYLAYDNYKAVMRWNRSLYFATSVGALAEAIKN